jgi:hypothetical protein
MRIHPGNSPMPEEPSHATLTIESRDPETNSRNIKRYRCEFDACERTYSTAGNLRTHMKTHKGEATIDLILEHLNLPNKLTLLIYYTYSSSYQI